MSNRPPAPPPLIPGFNHVHHLGSGGFADVYLYEEQLLGRKVAVKVLIAGELMADALANFTNEANLMAQLSNHPSIVSVYQAGVSDDGRPFIVMEYCSRPNLQARYRASRFSEAETLRVGIQIAGAVETAHRAGILHRDIKPANILVTDYGRPALTDFGIAATTASSSQAGLSVPWAPPESFVSGQVGDERSDIYSLGATLYTLLAGRTPFEVPGASNTSVDVMGRIQTGALPALGRADVSPALERALAVSMARNPAARNGSAMEFARALQRLQIELGMQATPVDVVEEATDLLEHEEDEGRTRIRSIVTIDAQQENTVDTARPVLRQPLPPDPPVVGDTQLAFRPAALPTPEAPPVEDTQLRAPRGSAIVAEPVQPPEETQAGKRANARVVVLAGVAVAVVLVVVLVVVELMGGKSVVTVQPPSASSAQPVDPAPVNSPVPQVAGLAGKLAGGKASFEWRNPDPQDGDTYLWRLVQPGVAHTYAEVTDTKVALAAVKGGQTCIEVVLRRSNGRAAEESVQECAQ
ncbi:MAG: protein kinase domain-containing protein [Propionicimonas sp.]